MKETITTKIEKAMKQDSLLLKKSSNLDVIDNVMHKITSKQIENNKQQRPVFSLSKLVFQWQSALSVTLIALFVIYFSSLKPENHTNSQQNPNKTLQITQIENPIDASIATEKTALNNDIIYLSKIFAL